MPKKKYFKFQGKYFINKKGNFMWLSKQKGRYTIPSLPQGAKIKINEKGLPYITQE